MIVAIDGPAGSGKSTVARRLAERLGFRYLDTGAMYRCVALAAIGHWGPTLPPEEERSPWEAALGRLAASLSIEFREAVSGNGNGNGEVDVDRDGASEGGRPASGRTHVLLDGQDVTGEIRSSAVSETASAVAAVAGVRTALVAKQRELVATGDWVAEGRDVGTVVAPAAELKVFLTADAAERARRRSAELGADERTVLAEQAIRDARDSEREHSPLHAATDAERIDTTALSIDDVVAKIAELAEARGSRR